MRRLPAEYRHEPGLALAGGKDGLDLVARILAEAPAHLAQRRMLVCEVGDGRKALERARPGAELMWLKDEVFIAGRDALASAARTARFASNAVHAGSSEAMSSRSRAPSQRRSAAPSLPGAISAARRLPTATSFSSPSVSWSDARREMNGSTAWCGKQPAKKSHA